MADQLKTRYGLNVTDVDPAAFGHQHELPAPGQSTPARAGASLIVEEIRALQAQLAAEQHQPEQRLRNAQARPDGTAAADDLEPLAARVQELQELHDLAEWAISPRPGSL